MFAREMSDPHYSTSAQPETHIRNMTVDSPIHRKRRLLGITMLFVFVLYSILLVVATHLPRVPAFVRGPGADKWLHFAAYGCQTVLAMSVFHFTNRLVLKNAIFLIVLLVTFGAIDELTQPLFSRQAELWDWVADCAGIVFGVCLAWFVVFIRGEIKHTRKEGRNA